MLYGRNGVGRQKSRWVVDFSLQCQLCPSVATDERQHSHTQATAACLHLEQMTAGFRYEQAGRRTHPHAL